MVSVCSSLDQFGQEWKLTDCSVGGLIKTLLCNLLKSPIFMKVMQCVSVILYGLSSRGVIFRVIWGVFIQGGLNMTSVTARAWNAHRYAQTQLLNTSSIVGHSRGRKKVINCKHIWINPEQDVEQSQVFLGREWKKERGKRKEDEGWTSQSSRVELPTAIFLSQRGSGGLFSAH